MRRVTAILWAPAAILGWLAPHTVTFADEPDPTTHFFYDGKLVGPRNLQVGDPTNWSTEVRDFEGQSESGKIVVSRDTYEHHGDAIHLSFNKNKTQGQFAIYGPAIDLSPYEAEGVLVMELRIDVMSRSPIMLGMDCSYPCRSEHDVRGQLRHFPRGEWFTFAVPINCFSLNEDAREFDLTRINSPLRWSTEGWLEMSIANVRLGLLPVGNPGCRRE